MLDCNSLASGDADVINTTLQLVLPCIDDVKILASVTGERISLTPDTPTMGEIEPRLGLALWNGLFVRKDTPRGFLYRPARDMISVDRFSVRPLRALMESRDEDVLDEYYESYITGLILINVIVFSIILSSISDKALKISIIDYAFIIIIIISTFLCIIIYEKTRKKWKKERKELIDQLEKAFNEFEIGYIMGEEYIESTSALREIIEKSRKWENRNLYFCFLPAINLDSKQWIGIILKNHLMRLK